MKTAPVRVRDLFTVGLGSVIGIGVTVGSDVQIGALSLVPKHAMLEGVGSTSECRCVPFASDASPSTRGPKHWVTTSRDLSGTSANPTTGVHDAGDRPAPRSSSDPRRRAPGVD